MKRYHIVYHETWKQSPLSFWVHRAVGGTTWHQAAAFDPPFPPPIPGKGYPYYLIEVDGFTFAFASIEEIDHCMTTLRQRHLPDTTRETEERGTGPGSHWLNKLPRKVRTWKYREKAIRYMTKIRTDFIDRLP
jgi:hypothetical protein